MSGIYEPIPYVGEHSEDDLDLFGEYRYLLPILIEGTRFEVPDDNSVLRGLQYLEIKHGAVKMPWPNYCWNDTEGCCEMTYRRSPGEAPKTGRACQIRAKAGLEIIVLPKGGKSCVPPK